MRVTTSPRVGLKHSVPPLDSMHPADLEQLRFLLAALREPRPSGQAEGQAVEGFRRHRPPRVATPR